jgi:hypothetical protein
MIHNRGKKMTHMKLTDYIVCCAWHEPRRTMVKVRTGEPVSLAVLGRVPETDLKRLVMESDGVCKPCMRTVIERNGLGPLAEKKLAAGVFSR